MVSIAFSTLDVFTERRFVGNPLAVVTGGESLNEGQMQAVAREFNLAETIFVLPPANPANTNRVRIFTPEFEMPFAGHPIVGCSVFLAERQHKPGCPFETTLRLEVKAGLVPVTVTRIAGASFARFTAPVLATLEPVDARPQDAAAALGLAPEDIGIDGHAVTVMAAGNRFLAVPVTSLDALARARVLEPAFGALSARTRCLGFYPYTNDGTGGWRVRMFAPAASVPEDPATGSAAAAFPAVLLAAGALRDGANAVAVRQGVEMRRASDIRVDVDVQDRKLMTVRIGGHAVPVSQGTMIID
jgi:trans-2,3-dihydro-3-hydroxyanthranilate isomerase